MNEINDNNEINFNNFSFNKDFINTPKNGNPISSKKDLSNEILYFSINQDSK